MLIVNADDLGLREEVSDAILECWQAGAITSASAMVAMADSERGFAAAAAAGLPLGLHLNLTTPFTAAGLAAEQRARQLWAVAYFGGAAWHRLGFDPCARGRLDACVRDQLDLFAALRGAPAAHADGHQHIQLCPTLLATAALGQVHSLRRAHAFVAAPSVAKDLYRRAVNRALRRRFRSVPFVSLRDLHPQLGGIGLDGLLAAVRGGTAVEVMTHPAWPEEREVLLSAEWRRLLAELPTGSHDDLG